MKATAISIRGCEAIIVTEDIQTKMDQIGALLYEKLEKGVDL